MKTTVGNGLITFSFGGKSPRYEDGYRFQLYWPTLYIRKYNPAKEGPYSRAEIYFAAPTTFRLVRGKDFWGVGGNLLGFGVGIDYEE